MQIKTIAMVAIAGSVIGLSTGCVKQQDYDNMVKQKDNEKKQAVAELNTKLTEKDSLLTAEKQKSRGLQNQLTEAATELSENKQKVESLQTKLDDANDKVSSLESSLKSTKSQLERAKSKAESAENEAASANMKAQESQRRFDMLRKALLDLNKKKPASLGIDLSDVEGSSSDTNGVSGMTGTDTSTDNGSQKANGSDSNSPENILDDMSNMQ